MSPSRAGDKPDRAVCAACGETILRYSDLWFTARLGGGYGCPETATGLGLHQPAAVAGDTKEVAVNG